MHQDHMANDEEKRVRALQELNVLDSVPEAQFDAIVKIASLICGVPISLISLVDKDRQWFKANEGLAGMSETPLEVAFCTHTIQGDSIMEVKDATLDVRFEHNPLVTGNPKIRFYAGAPLVLESGEHIGTLCVIDRVPRVLDEVQSSALSYLATVAVNAMESRAVLKEELMLRDAEARLASLFQHSIDSIIAMTLDGIVTHWNVAAQQLYGYSAEEMVGQSIRRLIPSERLKDEGDIATILLRNPHGIARDTVRLHRDGTAIDVSMSMIPIVNKRGEIIGATKIDRDVRDRITFLRELQSSREAYKNLSLDLAQQHELLRVTLQSIGDAVITTDGDGNVNWLNPIAERMTGWLNAEAKGKPLVQVFNILNEQTREPAENPVALCLQNGKIVGLANDTMLISKDGCEYGIEDSAAPICDQSGNIVGVVLVFHDVTSQRRISGEMTYRATHDSLTGLYNRVEFESRLKRAWEHSHENDSKHALMFIDLDQFKLVNDACGHSVGDILLQQVSKEFSQAIRERDMLARIGGDEFAIILEHCSSEQAEIVAQKICDRIDNFRFIYEEKRYRIGASIGLVPVDKRWSSVMAILQAADISCYSAKEEGRNRVHVWYDTDQTMQARHGEMQWTTRIEHALDANGFRLFAQPIKPIAGGNSRHAEVLLRMIDGDGTMISPASFFPAAERFHLASRIDRWVLRNAIDWLQSSPLVDSIETLSINLSGQSIGDRSFHRHAMEMLQATRASVLGRICLEITETVAITHMADATAFIEQVRRIGVRVALDDFGAGASSFGYLKALPVDFIKIDGQFVKDIIDDAMDDAAVRCFVAVGKILGVKTIAEFVHAPEIVERLRDIGVDYAQGYWYGRPTPIDEVFDGCASSIDADQPAP